MRSGVYLNDPKEKLVMRIPTAWWLVAAVSLVIAGCGGGGGGTGCGSNCPTNAISVAIVSPANGATGVAIGSAVTASFNIGANASTITTSTFTLSAQGGGAVAGTVSVAGGGLSATFTPNASLAYSTTYTATLTTSVQSTAGTALASNYTWSFTTAPQPNQPPTVTAETPGIGATGIAITTAVTATFSEAMNASTITGSTFTLTPQGGSAIVATVTYAATVATLTPNAPLANNTTYTATITTGVTSSAGTALTANHTWTFTTVAATTQPPQVTGVTPLSGSTSAAITTNVTATFNEAMLSSSITGSTFTLTGPGSTSVQGVVGCNVACTVATFTPTANLSYNTMYTATLTTSVTSSGNVALAAPYIWSFTTTTAPVPTVTTTVPASGATGVNVGNALTATFSVPMNSATFTASTVTLTGPGNTAVAGLISYNTGTSTVTFAPNASLAYNTSYTASITTGAQSSNNVALGSNYVWTFTTGASPNQVTVDFGAPQQTIRGFGGSTAWLGTMPSAVSTALFSPTNGLGLSILRVRIDPTGSSTSANPYETGDWDHEAANGREAVAANPNAIVFASPWTAPAIWKLSGTSTTVSGTVFNEAFNTGSCSDGTAAYCGGYLDPNHYADYANYLEDFVKFFNTTNSPQHLYAISMQNEPEENTAYESSVWTPQQMDTWISGSASTITSDPYSTKLIMPESDSFNPVDASVALSDASAQGLISIIGGHLYGVSPAPYSIPSGDSPKELWMTEFGPLSTATLTWAQALTTYGESIHNSMVTGQYNAYVWWGLFGASSGTCATNAGTCGLVDNAGTVQPMGYVMGQYSKFIQPGFVRVSATATPVGGVFVSAYSNASPAHYAIVVINSNSSSESLTFVLNNGSGVTSLTPYQSTSSAGLAAQTAVTVSSGQFSYTLPAQSIVTFYQ
jgi:O-glycosyl hydrolase